MPDKYTPPQRLRFKSDLTEVELSTIIPKSTHRKEALYEYIYTKASQKLGMKLPLRQSDIERLLEKEYASSF